MSHLFAFRFFVFKFSVSDGIRFAIHWITRLQACPWQRNAGGPAVLGLPLAEPAPDGVKNMNAGARRPTTAPTKTPTPPPL